MVWYDMGWYDMVWDGMGWYGMVWYDMVYGMGWYGMGWYDMVMENLPLSTSSSRLDACNATLLPDSKSYMVYSIWCMVMPLIL